MDQRTGIAAGHESHAGPTLGVSLLRLSVPARLVIAAAAALMLWGAALWALA
jgi:hypothetical protein